MSESQTCRPVKLTVQLTASDHCTNKLNFTNQPKQLDSYLCSLHSFGAGLRLTFFPTCRSIYLVCRMYVNDLYFIIEAHSAGLKRKISSLSHTHHKSPSTGVEFVYASSNEDYLGDIDQSRQESLRIAMHLDRDQFYNSTVRIRWQPVIRAHFNNNKLSLRTLANNTLDSNLPWNDQDEDIRASFLAEVNIRPRSYTISHSFSRSKSNILFSAPDMRMAGPFKFICGGS